jgi:uncharacterized protein (TIGR02300 family)
MAKPELGLKRVCVACGTRFYDLTRSPAICPKCGTEQPAEQPRLRRAAAPLPPEDKLKKRVAAGAAAEAEGEEVELEEVEGEEAIEDAEELEDEAEGIGEDIEVEGDRDEEG